MGFAQPATKTVAASNSGSHRRRAGEVRGGAFGQWVIAILTIRPGK
jgi:hypothetical protein